MLLQDKFEDTKGVIRNHKSKDRQHNGQKKDRQHNGQKKDRQHNGQKTEGQTTQWPKEKRTKGQTESYKTLYIKLKIE